MCASAQTRCRGTIFSRRTPRCGLNLAAVAPWRRGWHFGLARPIFNTEGRAGQGRGVEMKIHSGLHSGLRTIWGHIVEVRNYKRTHSVALRGRGDVLK